MKKIAYRAGYKKFKKKSSLFLSPISRIVLEKERSPYYYPEQ
jgi:hypothetical protein